MAEAKTKKTNQDPKDFIRKVEIETRRNDAFVLLEMMEEITGMQPKMYGPSIIGFDEFHYVSPSGSTGDWPIAAFSPRKQSLVLYILPRLLKQESVMKKLGKCKTGVSCLYINKLSDIDLHVLRSLIEESVKQSRKKYKTTAESK